MRISDSVLTNMILDSASSNYQVYSDTIQKIAKNKNFSKVSEDPNDASKVLKLNNQLSQLNLYQSNIQAATNEMNYTYDILGGISDEITSINSLIVEAANASTSADSAKAIAAEIEERVNVIKDKLNAKYMDNYIFSGTYTATQAYKDVGGDIIYQGSPEKAGARKLTIAEGVQFQYNITGDSLFGDQTYYFEDEDGNEQAITSDFFSQMKDLRNLLTADTLDFAKIREKLQVTQGAIDSTSLARGKVSAQVSKLETTKNLNDDAIISITENKSELEEVDVVKAASDLTNAQAAMQASYLLTSRVLSNVSLLDYL